MSKDPKPPRAPRARSGRSPGLTTTRVRPLNPLPGQRLAVPVTPAVPRPAPAPAPAAPSPLAIQPEAVLRPELLPRPPWASLLTPEANLFSPARPGRPVVRDEDLLALRIELVGLRTVDAGPGQAPRLQVQPGGGPAVLLLHLPPQALGEQTFFHQRTSPPDPAPEQAQKGGGSGTEVPPLPPVRARSAGETRLAFRVPPDFDCAYTLEALLAAVRQLEPALVPVALPPGAGPRAPKRWLSDTVFVDRALIGAGAARRLALQQLAAPPAGPSRRPAARAGTAATASAALALPGPAALARQARAQQRLMRQEGEDSPLLLRREDRFRFVETVVAPDLRPLPRPVLPPAPREPLPHETAIEMPWRLLLSPQAAGRWQHALRPVTSRLTGRTELWHARLGDSSPLQARALPPPGRDEGPGAMQALPQPVLRPPALRAVWARDGVGAEAPRNAQGQPAPMRGQRPVDGSLPVPDDEGSSPFRVPMDDHDRQQIVHLSANFRIPGYTPQAVPARRLMLSALGGWLDARGAWSPPPGLSVEEWVHRAAQGRDHQVRIVYQGRLFPFGHRAVLVKVSERHFYKEGDDPGLQHRPGNPAYLRQRMFIVVREPERSYTDASLQTPDGASFLRRFPFARVRITSTVTPDLALPTLTALPGMPGRVFWPALAADRPFRFACTATDLAGRRVDFELPMIFIDALAGRPVDGQGRVSPPLAQGYLRQIQQAWRDRANATGPGATTPAAADWTAAEARGQRLSLAPEDRPGDTSVEALWLRFDAEIDTAAGSQGQPGGTGLLAQARGLAEPYFFPALQDLQVRIGAAAVLSGSGASNRLRFNALYLRQGLAAAANRGQVFAEVLAQPAMGALDFSTQGNRSGGFVMPNLTPSALSRLAGPVAGDVGKFASDFGAGGGMFDGGQVPLPLLFGCIPLSAVVQGLADLGQVPKFVSDAADVVGSLIGEVERLMNGADPLAGLAAALARAAVQALQATVIDLVQQAQLQAVGPMATAAAQLQLLTQRFDALRAALDALADTPLGGSLGQADPAALAAALGTLQTRATALATALDDVLATLGAPGLPPAWLQEVQQGLTAARRLLDDLARLPQLLAEGTALVEALGDLLGELAGLDDTGDAAKEALITRLEAVQDAGSDLRLTLGAVRLLEGAPRQLLLDGLKALDTAVEIAQKGIDLLFGEELTVRFDWAPRITSVPAAPGTEIFRANDPRGFVVAVVARMKKSGGAPTVEVVCSLKHFDLVLIGAAGFLELNFEKIEFRADADLKTNVDVLFSGIKFIGPLSFVETLRDLIPLDGFSDPPYLDVSPRGIDAGFSLALPSVAVGMFSLSNLSLGAGFTVPFIGQPLSVRFNFCSREQPFCLTVAMLGGGGFFGITIDPKGVQLLEASLEFGACLSVNLGVASGSVHIMAGIYFRMQQSDCTLTGYLRIGGEVDVLGLISASIELYMELSYQSSTGKVIGRATITIEVSVFCFSASVKVSAERKFAGSNGDPSFRQLMGPAVAVLPTAPLDEDLAALAGGETCAWHDYAAAFA